MLRDGGCFLELGKRGILSQEDVVQRRPDVEYYTYTLNEFLADEPEKRLPMLNELSHYLEAGKIQPLPYQVFDFQSGLVDAFKHLRDGSNIGKIVIQMKRIPSSLGTAIITGGLGGLGLVTAELLSDLGAKHVVLVSRSGKAKNYSGQQLEEKLKHLRQLDDGNRVSVERCDMSNEEEVKVLLDRVRANHGCINTIIHASGMLRDSWLHNLTPEAIQESFRPKAASAWYLHKHTLKDDV